MAFALDPVTVVNLIFCIVIVIFGYWAYKKMENPLPLGIAIAFGLFGISHLAVLLGFQNFEISLIVIRTFAYLIVIFVLYNEVFR